MEFKEYVTNFKRMCNYFAKCEDCPIPVKSTGHRECENWAFNNMEHSEKIVSEWVEKHLKYTRSDKFKSVFGTPLIIDTDHPGSFYIMGVNTLVDAENWLKEEYVDKGTNSGHWIKSKDSYGSYHYRCSVCGNDVIIKGEADFHDKYCSNCGAKND